jgi:hypothetical protein
VDLREHGDEPLRRRRHRRQKAHLVAELHESAVGDEAVQMHVQAEVAPKSLDHRDVRRRQYAARTSPTCASCNASSAAPSLAPPAGRPLRDRRVLRLAADLEVELLVELPELALDGGS